MKTACRHDRQQSIHYGCVASPPRLSVVGQLQRRRINSRLTAAGKTTTASEKEDAMVPTANTRLEGCNQP
jgi:hypothetical protein